MLELAHKDSVAFSAQAATLAAYRAPTLLQSFFECRDTMMRRLAVSLARRQEVGVRSALTACLCRSTAFGMPQLRDRRSPCHPPPAGPAAGGLFGPALRLERAAADAGEPTTCRGQELIASAALPALQAPKSLCALLPRLSQAVHPAAAARLAEQPASSSSGSAAEQQTQQPQQQPVQGATESVVFSSIAKAAAEANKRPASGVPGVTKFLGFTGEGGWLGQLLQLLQHWRTLCMRARRQSLHAGGCTVDG